MIRAQANIQIRDAISITNITKEFTVDEREVCD